MPVPFECECGGTAATEQACLNDPSWLNPAVHSWTVGAPPRGEFDAELAGFARNFRAS